MCYGKFKINADKLVENFIRRFADTVDISKTYKINIKKDISSKLGTEEYKRLKVGIANNKNMDTKDYVLGRFSKEEKELIDEAINESTKIIDDYFKYPFNDLMSRYNGVYDGLSN